MDIDGDGQLDVISGSYWPGDIFWFKGLGGWRFETAAELKDGKGLNLNAGGPWKSDRDPDMESLASAPFATDFDDDGDLDLLVGNIAGHVVLILNEGNAKKPAFSTKKPLQAAGEVIVAPGGDAGPVVADWDGDQKPDLIVGAGDGSVWFYRNVRPLGERGAPTYAQGKQLIQKTAVDWNDLPLSGTKPASPGMRTKVCVTDYNGDGILDLLVGDVFPQRKLEPKLTPEQVKKRDELRRRREELSNEYSKVDDPRLSKISEELVKVFQELDPLEAGTETHGWVWLYLRKNDKGTTRTARL